MESAKSKKAKEMALNQQLGAERDAASAAQAANIAAQNQVSEAGKTARSQMIESAKPNPEETARLQRYQTKATTPGEVLMQQQGPIAQAVARRVQERIDQPGLDYNTQSADFTEGITLPMWRALKARGIVAPPGTEGGGLATQQYMKGATPALAELRSNQINTDINRAMTYGTQAQAHQSQYEELLNALANALGQRQYQSGIYGAQAQQGGAQQAAPYGVAGAEAYGTGIKNIANINKEDVYGRYNQRLADQQALGTGAGKALSALLMANPATAPIGMAGLATLGSMPTGSATSNTGLVDALTQLLNKNKTQSGTAMNVSDLILQNRAKSNTLAG